MHFVESTPPCDYDKRQGNRVRDLTSMDIGAYDPQTMTPVSKRREALVVFFVFLVCAASVKRRLADLDLDWGGGLQQFENDGDPDDDQIIERLNFGDDAVRLAIPAVIGLGEGAVEPS